jgi:hypothetical protein
MSIMQGIVDDWNAKCPVGTPVVVDVGGQVTSTKTSRLAFIEGECALVFVEDRTNPINLKHVKTYSRDWADPISSFHDLIAASEGILMQSAVLVNRPASMLTAMTKLNDALIKARWFKERHDARR